MDVAIQQQPLDLKDLFASTEARRGAPAAQPVRPQLAQLAQPQPHMFDLAGMQASVLDGLLPDLHFPDLPPLPTQLGGSVGGLALASFEQLQAFMQQPLGGGGKHAVFPQGK